MDGKGRRYMSDPDENGIRYFDVKGDIDALTDNASNKAENTAASPNAQPAANSQAGCSSGWVSTNKSTAANAGNAQKSFAAGGSSGMGGGNFGGGSGGRSGGAGRTPKFWRNVSIVLAIVLAVICITSAVKGAVRGVLGINGNQEAYSYSELPNSPYIATLYVEGTIQADNVDYLGRSYGYQHAWTLETIDDLIYDDDNYGLILFVDSPGGTIYESDELYFKIKEYQDITERPVYAVMGSTAASGGYYISAPCDKIYANRNTWTGSIGVTIGTIVDFSQFLENYGIRTKTITSGANKAMGSNYQEMTAEEEAIWQELVNEAYEQFVEVVADGRNMSMQEVYDLADGRIYSAKQAIDAGLVDEIGGIEEAYYNMYEEIASRYGDEYVPAYMERVDVEYKADSTSLSWLLGSALSAIEMINAESGKDSVVELAESINSHPASYICEILAD